MFYPQRVRCYASMELAAANWRFDEIHEAEPFHNGDESSWSATRSTDHPYHFRDGVTVFVAPTDFAPDDEFLTGPDSGHDPEGEVEDGNEA